MTETVNHNIRPPASPYGHPRFYELLDKMAKIHSEKNHDYAGEGDPLQNFKSVERIDVLPSRGALIRMFDKWSRLENYVKTGKLYVEDESVYDTLIDLANYAILMLILLEEEAKDTGHMTATEAATARARELVEERIEDD